MTQRPVIGSSVDLNVGKPSGVPTAGLMLISTERAALPSMLGGQFLAIPEMLLSFAIPAGGAKINTAIPNDNTLVGNNVLAQALLLDAGARFQVAFSRGLEVSLGR